MKRGEPHRSPRAGRLHEALQRAAGLVGPLVRGAERRPGPRQNTGVPGLPETDDWTVWDADQMRAAIEHLEHGEPAQASRFRSGT